MISENAMRLTPKEFLPMGDEKKTFFARNKRYIIVAVIVYVVFTLLLILSSIGADDSAFVYQMF